jgi:hypothetical protein
MKKLSILISGVPCFGKTNTDRTNVACSKRAVQTEVSMVDTRVYLAIDQIF